MYRDEPKLIAYAGALVVCVSDSVQFSFHFTKLQSISPKAHRGGKRKTTTLTEDKSRRKTQ